MQRDHFLGEYDLNKRSNCRSTIIYSCPSDQKFTHKLSPRRHFWIIITSLGICRQPQVYPIQKHSNIAPFWEFTEGAQTTLTKQRTCSLSPSLTQYEEALKHPVITTLVLPYSLWSLQLPLPESELQNLRERGNSSCSLGHSTTAPMCSRGSMAWPCAPSTSLPRLLPTTWRNPQQQF